MPSVHSQKLLPTLVTHGLQNAINRPKDTGTQGNMPFPGIARKIYYFILKLRKEC